jgi:hypothetical protein
MRLVDAPGCVVGVGHFSLLRFWLITASPVAYRS